LTSSIQWKQKAEFFSCKDPIDINLKFVSAEFPFISYYVINKGQQDPVDFFRTVRTSALEKFDPKSTRYTAHHTLDLFNEVATIARPPLSGNSRRPISNNTGYIISVYKVFEGDDGEKFEKNWLYWTGKLITEVRHKH